MPRALATQPNPALVDPTASSATEINRPGQMGGVVVEEVTAATIDAWGDSLALPTPRAGLQVIADAYGNIYTFGGRDQNYVITPDNDMKWHCLQPSQGWFWMVQLSYSQNESCVGALRFWKCSAKVAGL